MNAYIDGKAVTIDPARALGKGGEADVFDIGNNTALKIYKTPDHPDFAGNPTEQEYVRNRIKGIQEKLREFPKTLPERVVTPKNLATDQYNSRIVGYTMRLVPGAEPLARYAERNFRRTAGISTPAVINVLRDLHATVNRVHETGTIVGDFSDLNVLVSGDAAYLIDADSFQFGKFICPMFTERFVDPLLCDQNKASLTLICPHRCSSDWYAFAVMLMQCLLFVHPYGGIYRPKEESKRMLAGARPLHRITIFNPEVVYPEAGAALQDSVRRSARLFPSRLRQRRTRRISGATARVSGLDKMSVVRHRTRAAHVPQLCSHRGGHGQSGGAHPWSGHDDACLPDPWRDLKRRVSRRLTALDLPR